MNDEVGQTDGHRRRTRVFACSVVGIGLAVLSAVLLWLGFRLPWQHDPLRLGVYEDLIEAQGYGFDAAAAEDGIEGYAVRARDEGQWLERIYVHPETGGEIRLTRSLRQNAPGLACTVRSLNAEGRAALVRAAGEFSPYLTARIAEAEQEYRRTEIWVRVTAPDFDISVTTDSLTLDSRPGEYTGMGIGRVIERFFWRLSRLSGKA